MDGASIIAAELEGASSVVRFLRAYFQGHATAEQEIAQFSIMDYRTIQALSLSEMV